MIRVAGPLRRWSSLLLGRSAVAQLPLSTYFAQQLLPHLANNPHCNPAVSTPLNTYRSDAQYVTKECLLNIGIIARCLLTCRYSYNGCMGMRLRGLILALCVTTTTIPLTADDWREFRGPTGQGHAPDTNPPIEWSETQTGASGSQHRSKTLQAVRSAYWHMTRIADTNWSTVKYSGLKTRTHQIRRTASRLQLL